MYNVLYDIIYIAYTIASKWIKKLKGKTRRLFIWVHPQSFRNNFHIVYADEKSTNFRRTDITSLNNIL